MRQTLSLTSLALLLSLTSCEYKELCLDHSHVVDVRIDYDWQAAPEANPAGMSAYLFFDNTRTGYPERYDFTGKTGGSIRVESGYYQTLGVNHDTEAILYRGTGQLETFEAYTRRSSLEEGTEISTRYRMPQADGTEDQTVVLEPDPLWGGAGDDLSLACGQQGAHATIRPQQLVMHFEVVLHNVPNLQYTGQFGGSISGLAGSVLVADGQLGDEQVIISFPVRQTDEHTLVAEFNSFGHCPHAEDNHFNRHIFTLYAVLADGSKWYYSEDVTAQMHDPVQNPDKYHIYIQLDEPPVPKPIVNGSGFHPEIDGWTNEEIIVGM